MRKQMQAKYPPMSTAGQEHRSRIERKCMICAGPKASHLYVLDEGHVIKCAKCQLLSRHPMPTDAALSEYYDAAHKGMLDDAMSTEAIVANVLASKALSLITNHQKKTWVDYGSGDGSILSAGCRHQPKITALGVEPFGESPILKKSGFESVPIYPSLPDLIEKNQDCEPDLITMFEVIEHLINPLDVLKSLKPFLDKDGILFITTPNPASLRARLDQEKWREYNKLSHLYWFNEKTMKQMLFNAGFNRVRIYSKALHSSRPGLSSTLRRPLELVGLQGTLAVMAQP